ncbi:MAG TPA: helix-turn-helix transcriptional regulator, partial [Limnobacter sp.]|nr:helix-turn-helix transcriptional regulator [Limnobacter sp.]
SVDDVAQSLHVSPRTLKRKLQAEGKHFTELLGEVVQRDACLLLETSRLTVDEIAARVGYQDRANFTRAFKKRAGKTPSEYRLWIEAN